MKLIVIIDNNNQLITINDFNRVPNQQDVAHKVTKTLTFQTALVFRKLSAIFKLSITIPDGYFLTIPIPVSTRNKDKLAIQNFEKMTGLNVP